MKPNLCLILVLIVSVVSAEEIMFFADDRYKAVGAPHIEASVINPLMEPGERTVLRVVVANHGLLEELIPVSQYAASEGTVVAEEIADEMAAEMAAETACIDAVNVTLTLRGSGPVIVTSGRKGIESLPSGAVATVEFSAAVADGAEGPQDLFLDVDYERQVDVSTEGDALSPLYQPESVSIPLRVTVRGRGGDLTIEGVSSDIPTGGPGVITAIIRNRGDETLANCTANLISAPPIELLGDHLALGDIGPGDMAVMRFAARADASAAGDYRLACDITHDGGREVLPLTVCVSAMPRRTAYLPTAAFLAAGAAGILLLARLRGRGRRHGP